MCLAHKTLNSSFFHRRELLERYSECRSRAEVLSVQKTWLEEDGTSGSGPSRDFPATSSSDEEFCEKNIRGGVETSGQVLTTEDSGSGEDVVVDTTNTQTEPRT